MGQQQKSSEEIEVRKREIILGNFKQVFVIGIFNAVILAALLFESASPLALVAWVLCIAGLTSARAITVHQMRGPDGRPSEAAIRWYVRLTFASGLVWGTVPFFIEPDAPPTALHIVVFMVAGTTAGAAVAYAPCPRAVTAFNLPVLGLLGVYYVLQAGPYEFAMTGMLVLYFFATKGFARHYERTLKKTLAANLDLEQAHHTVQMQAEELKKLARSNAGAAREAKAAVEAKSAFLANMSHELRTPLNAIIGFAEMMNEGVLGKINNETYALYVQHILKSAKHLLTIINQVLDYARLQSGKVTLEQQPFDIKGTVRTAVASLTPIAAQKQIDLRLNFGPDIPGLVLGDEPRVLQVLFNLVGNAIKFTEHGYVEVDLYVRSQTDCSCRLQLAVSDTGIGISKKDQRRLFRRFEQGHANSRSRTGGTGLGLAISQELVQLMGGDITVESTLGKGSSFTVDVTFPLPPASAVAAHRACAEAVEPVPLRQP